MGFEVDGRNRREEGRLEGPLKRKLEFIVDLLYYIGRI
jgi:hypothetical protein